MKLTAALEQKEKQKKRKVTRTHPLGTMNICKNVPLLLINYPKTTKYPINSCMTTVPQVTLNAVISMVV